MSINTTPIKTLSKYWIFLLLSLYLGGCQTTGSGPAGKSAGIDSLNQAQSARFQQALDSLEHQQPQTAERLLKDLVQERSDVAELWVNLALSQYQQKNFKTAESTVKESLVLFPRIPQTLNLAGLLAVEKGEFKQAEQFYSKALALEPAYANALYNMALLQDIYLRNIASAVEYYNRYLQQVQDDEATRAWADNLLQSLAR